MSKFINPFEAQRQHNKQVADSIAVDVRQETDARIVTVHERIPGATIATGVCTVENSSPTIGREVTVEAHDGAKREGYGCLSAKKSFIPK